MVAQTLLLLEYVLAPQEPLRIALDVALGHLERRVTQIGIVLADLELFLVLLLVLLVHFPHFFDLVEVYDEAALVRVVLLYALATEDGQVI